MRKFARLISLLLVLMVVAVFLPTISTAAVSVPSKVKSVVFNAEYYAKKYSDLKAAFGTDATKLYNHFLNYGIREGRQASPMFSVDHYLNGSGDLKAAFGTNRESALAHFINYGVKEPRVTAPAVNLGTGIDVRIAMKSGGMNLGYSDTNVQTVAPVLEANQFWTLDRQSDGSYKITNKETGKVLDVLAGSKESGTNVCIYPSNNTNAQRWYIYKNANGTYSLRAKCGTTCVLTVSGGSTAAGANVLMSTYTGDASQQFTITQAGKIESMTPVNVGSNFWGNIKGVGSKYNLALSGNNVVIRYPNTGYNQIWRFIRFGDGSYEITNLKNGKSLDCATGAGTAGTNVQSYTSNNTNAQRWYIYKIDGNYVFVPKCSFTCALEVSGGKTASGTNLELATYSATSKAQQFKITKLTDNDTEKNIAISEICPTPSNGAYEFMEITNVSNETVNLKEYSLYRFGFSNSGKYESSGYHTVLGLVSGTGSKTDLSCLDKINLSSYDTEIKPDEVVVLWFVTYANRNLTVDNFKAYWESLGNNMSNVKVVPVKIHDGKADLYAATNINSGSGVGFLPDKKAGVALSMIKNTALSTRLENGKNLKDFTATTDAPLEQKYTAELHKVSDSIAVYFVSSSAKTAKSYNYYNYVDQESYAIKATEAMAGPMLDYTHVFTLLPYSSQVIGLNGKDGCPVSVEKYINLNSAGETNVVAIGVNSGDLKTMPNPGVKCFGQYAGLDLIGAKADSNGKVTFTGFVENDEYSKAGFVITTVCTETGVSISQKTAVTTTFTPEANGYKYSVTVSGLPVKDGSVVLRVVPYAVCATTGARVNGTMEQIRCPLVSATLNGKCIEGLKVTYLANEVNSSIKDITGIKEAVELLANDIEYYTGVEVETGVYDPRADYPQIIVASSGENSGGGALVANNKTVKENQYSIINKTTGELYIVGGSALAAEYASQLLVGLLANATDTVEFTSLCADTPKTFDMANNNLSLTDGADYRIMSFNIQDYSFNKDETRYAQIAKLIQYYDADVIGFQEYGEEIDARFTSTLKSLGYTFIGNEVSGSHNRVPLAYKTSRFTCVKKGWSRLPGEVGDRPWHGVSWAVLKDKTTGQIFAVTTSHFYNQGTLENKVLIRQENSRTVLNITNDIIKNYNCPVINTGDFNMRSFDEAYHIMVSAGTLTDSRFIAARDGIMTRIGHTLGSSIPAEGSPTRTIDYFFVTDDVNVLRNRASQNMTSGCATDHFPLYVDISFAA